MPKVSAEYLAERRSHILSAAAKTFARDGFHRSSMQNVIDEAGLSPGAVYRYFKSKDDIIAAIAAESISFIEGTIRATLHTQRPFGEQLEGLPAELLTLPDSSARMRLAVQAWSESLRSETVGDAVGTGVAALRSTLSERIAMAQEAGEVDPGVTPIDLTRAILAVIQGFIVQRAWDPELDPGIFGAAIRSLVAAAGRRKSRA